MLLMYCVQNDAQWLGIQGAFASLSNTNARSIATILQSTKQTKRYDRCSTVNYILLKLELKLLESCEQDSKQDS